MSNQTCRTQLRTGLVPHLLLTTPCSLNRLSLAVAVSCTSEMDEHLQSGAALSASNARNAEFTIVNLKTTEGMRRTPVAGLVVGSSADVRVWSHGSGIEVLISSRQTRSSCPSHAGLWHETDASIWNHRLQHMSCH